MAYHSRGVGTDRGQQVGAIAARVFISYSHDSELHRKEVFDLAQRLRADGVDVWIDQFEDPPLEGWPPWTQKQLTTASFVLVVCTENYCRRFEGEAAQGEGQGVKWEGFLIQTLIYSDDARNRRFIPVLLNGAKREDVPLVFRATTAYRLPESYKELRSRLTNQSAVAPVPLSCETPSRGAAGDPELVALPTERMRIRGGGGDTSALDDRILRHRLFVGVAVLLVGVATSVVPWRPNASGNAGRGPSPLASPSEASVHPVDSSLATVIEPPPAHAPAAAVSADEPTASQPSPAKSNRRTPPSASAQKTVRSTKPAGGTCQLSLFAERQRYFLRCICDGKATSVSPPVSVNSISSTGDEAIKAEVVKAVERQRWRCP